MSEARKMEIAFVNLVSALTASAMQQLGKLVNPLTGKTEINLAGAKSSIDLLEMLRVKTKGNLNQDETRLLDVTIANLQLNYVDESSRGENKEKPSVIATDDADVKDAKGKAH